MKHPNHFKIRHRYFLHLYKMQKGAVAVEMACISVVMFLLFAGLFEFSRAFWYYNALDKATRDAARFISALPTVTITNSTTIGPALSTATDLALITANGANVSPVLTASNIEIKCDLASCTGIKPENITVRIVNFSVKLGGIVPFISVAGGGYGNATLSPSTTMRYMN
jgi:hypothetical protein